MEERMLERFYFEVPSLDRKEEAIQYIEEFRRYESSVNGSGGLPRFMDNYEGWLEKLDEDSKRVPDEKFVPSRTYFLVREGDKKIIGMINIRLALNEHLKKVGGHIGYSIRPTERGKGYNKINLYLGLKVCEEHGIFKVFMDANSDNPASWRTMEALGGVFLKEYFYELDHCMVKDYEIDVKKSLKEYASLYEPFVVQIEEKRNR